MVSAFLTVRLSGHTPPETLREGETPPPRCAAGSQGTAEARNCKLGSEQL
jgi:hypothetical protein